MPFPPPGAKAALKFTEGGFQSASIFSGAVAPGLNCAPNAVAVGADVMLFSGTGRLDTVLVHQNTAASGYNLSIVFYDAAAPVSGGPLYSSGHKLICFAPAFANPVSGSSASSGNVPGYPITWGNPVAVMAPFQSGLCMNSRSGQPGVTVTWTPEFYSP